MRWSGRAWRPSKAFGGGGFAGGGASVGGQETSRGLLRGRAPCRPGWSRELRAVGQVPSGLAPARSSVWNRRCTSAASAAVPAGARGGSVRSAGTGAPARPLFLRWGVFHALVLSP